MSNIHRLSLSTQVYDEASAWIAKLDSGLSAEEEGELQQWLAVSRQNQELLFEMAALWDRMSVLSRLSEICPHPVDRSTRFPWIALAASLLIVVSVGIWAGMKHFTRESPVDQQIVVTTNPENIYETAIGEQSKINLPDGTELVLNTNTLVRARYTDEHRLLTLERGEIHVLVAHENSRPLSVIAGDKIVQAVGTAFNIEINSNHEIELLVTAGKVRVGVYQPTPAGTAQSIPPVLPQSSILVSAGEETILESPEAELETIDIEEIAVKLSWREGNLVFRGESLEEAVTEIGRYTAVEFVILDEKSRNVRVAGLFKAGDVNGLLAALEENFNVTYRRVGDNRIELRGR